MSGHVSHAAHCSTFTASWDGEKLDVRPHPADPDPSPILGNWTDVLRHRARILPPAVRTGWLENSPMSGRRRLDRFVEMDGDEVLPLVATTIGEVRERCGLSMGAWFGPASQEADRSERQHGNPNTVCRDIGTSKLAQGCSGQVCIVAVSRYEGAPSSHQGL